MSAVNMMKYVLLILVVFIAASCNTRNPDKASEKNIIVTIEPQKAVVNAIAGNDYNVEVLMPAGANHESYEPAPGDIAKLGKAGAYFSLGLLDFEKSWVSRFSEQFPDLEIVNTSEKCSLLQGHECTGDHEHHDHGTDPHTWLSISETKKMALVMKEYLQKSEPDKADFFEKNYNEFCKKADSADQVIKTMLSSLPSRSFMIYHPALGYFARDYDLNQVAIEDEGKEPSVTHIKQVVEQAAKDKMTFIFVSLEFDVRNAETIARETGASIVTFNPMAADFPGNIIEIARLISEN